MVLYFLEQGLNFDVKLFNNIFEAPIDLLLFIQLLLTLTFILIEFLFDHLVLIFYFRELVIEVLDFMLQTQNCFP